NELGEPLKLDNIELGAHRGLIPFSRWTGIQPEGEVETDFARPSDYNLPKYYRVNEPGAASFRVHASRVLRFTGPTVPAPELQAQAWWGISVLEPAYEEIRKRDNMSWAMLSVMMRASILGIRFKELAQGLSGAGMNQQALQQFYARMEVQNHLLSSQSLLVLPEDGGLESIINPMTGYSDVYQQFQLDIAGAANSTVTRLFGRTITGLGQSNDGDERLYEERIALEQEDSLRPQLEKLYPVICMSELGEVPDDLDLKFPSVRVLTEEEKSKLASDSTTAIVAALNAGLLNKPQALKELKQQSDLTGIFSNITDEDIAEAERAEELGLGGGLEGETEEEFGETEEVPRETEPEGGETDVRAADDWAEAKHPREKGGAEAGQFAAGSGGGGGGASAALSPAPKDRKKWPEHIQALKLPPAWTDVRVNSNPDADLLAVGKDAKGRPQYVYSKRFQNTQAEAKFARIKELDGKFDKIRRQNEENLKSDNPAKRENAECARLVMSTGIRPGSDSDRKAKVKAYGATTLEGQHVVKQGDRVRLRFVGKKGVAIDLPVEDPQVASALLARSKKAGASGRLFPEVSGASLLDYTHTLDGGGFKTKDFRTLLATRSAMNEIKKAEPPKTERDYKKRVLEIAKAVSSRLGNTPVVCLQSYINPIVFAPWRSSLAAA
ncbi:MAG TPA: anti-CBASS Acb1 family protein, partial [Polyangia bacterium]|nr:anti-CBASS Acb1 family protein [Polyangia bacterium]